MGAYIEFSFTIKATAKQDYDQIQIALKKGPIKSILSEERGEYLEELAKRNKADDVNLTIGYDDASGSASPDAREIFEELLKYIVRESASISFEAQADYVCEYGDYSRTCSQYVCRNGKLAILQYHPLQWFLDEKYDGDAIIIPETERDDDVQDLISDIVWDAPVETATILENSSYLSGEYLVPSGERTKFRESMIRDEIVGPITSIFKNIEFDLYARYCYGKNVKYAHFVYSNQKLSIIDVPMDGGEYPKEKIIDVNEKREFHTCNTNFNNDWDEDEEVEEDW